MNDIGQGLKRVRKEHHLTQKELGDLCGFTQQRIAQYETGYRCPKAVTIKKIAQAYGMEFNEFYGLYIEQITNDALIDKRDDIPQTKTQNEILCEILSELKAIHKLLGE